jgi:hypothetical protein
VYKGGVASTFSLLGIYFDEWETKKMNRENIVGFYLQQKMSGNIWHLFSDFMKEKLEKEKSEILDKWNQVDQLLKEIEESLGLNK